MQFNPSTIKSPYALLSIFLVILDSVFIAFRSQSQNPIEQYMLTGGIIIISIVFLFTVYQVYKIEKSHLSIDGNKINLHDSSNQNGRRIGSNKGDYSIIPPSGNWIQENNTTITIHKDFFNVKIDWFKDNIRLLCPLDSEILTFRSNEIKSIESTKSTLINGEQNKRAREHSFSTTMSIFPIEKYNPKFMRAETILGTLDNNSRELDRMGYQNISKKHEEVAIGKHTAIKREYKQYWQNVLIDSVLTESIKINLAVFVIEGKTRNYIFIIRYLSGNSTEEQKQKIRDMTTQLCNSIQSFDVQTPLDHEKQIESSRSKTNVYREKFAKLHINKRKFERAFEEIMRTIAKSYKRGEVDMTVIIGYMQNLKETAEKCYLYYEDINDFFKLIENEKNSEKMIRSKFEELLTEFEEWSHSPEAFMPLDMDELSLSKNTFQK